MAKYKFISSAQASSINDLMMTNINIPSLEDVAAVRCIEHWYSHTKGFRHIAINMSDMAAISKDGNYNVAVFLYIACLAPKILVFSWPLEISAVNNV